MKKYDTILFDADGTLFDFDRSEANAVGEVLTMCGLPSDNATVELYHRINDAEWKALERGETTRDRLKVDRFAKLKSALAERGVVTMSTEREMCDLYAERLSRQCIMVDGAVEVCERLSRTHALYIITNGITHVQKSRFSRSPIMKYFGRMFISDEMGSVKPERRFFELVFDALGMTPDEAAARCLVVGDSLTSDIKGAEAAGLDSCLYAPCGTAAGDVTPTYTISSLYELYGILGG